MFVHVPSEAGTKVAFAILRRLFPFTPKTGPHAPTLETLQAKYRKWEYLSIVLFLVVLPLTVYGWTLAFREGARFFAAQHQPAVFFVMLEQPWFLLPSIFLGIVSTAPLLYVLLNLLLQDRYPEYVYYGNLKNGFDSTKSFGVCAFVMLLLCLCGSMMLMDQYTRFTPETITIKHMLSMGEVKYPYSQVVSIGFLNHTTDNTGESNHDPQYRICMADGTLWRIQTYQETNTPEAQTLEKQIIAFIARQSHRPIQTLNDPTASPYDSQCKTQNLR